MVQLGGRSSLYATCPIFCKILNDPKYLGEQLVVVVRLKCCAFVHMQLQVNVVANVKAMIQAFLVGLLLHVIPGTINIEF